MKNINFGKRLNNLFPEEIRTGMKVMSLNTHLNGEIVRLDGHDSVVIEWEDKTNSSLKLIMGNSILVKE